MRFKAVAFVVVGAALLCTMVLHSAGARMPEWEERRPVRNVSLTDYYQKLIAFWEARYAADPHNFLAARKIASARLGLARATGDEAQYTHAEELLKHARAITPANDYQTEVLHARAGMARHDFKSAFEAAVRLLEQYPDSISLTELRGDAALGLGDYEQAFKDYRRLNEGRPGFGSYVRMADMFELQGRVEEARTFLHRALKAYEGDRPEPAAWIRLRIGISYLKQGKLTEAEEAFRRSLAIAPEYYLAQEHLAEVYEIRKEPLRAKPLLEQALQTNRDPGLLLRLAAVEREVESEERAAALEKEARQLIYEAAEGSDAHLRELAELLLDEGRELPRALTLAQLDLQVRSGDLRAHYVLARAYRLNGEPAKARAHILQALRLGTLEADFYLEAAEIEQALGNEAKAAELQQRAREINPYAA